MARRKTAEPESGPATTTETAPPEPVIPATDTGQEAVPETAATACPGELPPSDTNGSGERRPVKTLTYLIGRDTYAQVSIWDRQVNLRDGRSFTAFDISLRKRYRANGEWKSLYSWNASEVYALIHGLNQATAWVTQMRAAEAECPF